MRCLSEGVDVPSLDAVLFLSARNSQVDVVQSVGRVMRTFHKGQLDEEEIRIYHHPYCRAFWLFQQKKRLIIARPLM